MTSSRTAVRPVPKQNTLSSRTEVLPGDLRDLLLAMKRVTQSSVTNEG
jgi:hypothetical protein